MSQNDATVMLAIDIGNTSISFGVFKGRRIVMQEGIPTGVSIPRFKFNEARDKRQLEKRLGIVFQGIHSRYPGIARVVTCSVVPEALRAVQTGVLRHLRVKPLVVGKDIEVPLKNNYRDPRQVGQDRLVVAYAAKYLYGQPLIVIDFGTATTFDVVSPRGDYEGGIIVPGIRLSAESLFQKTALLPRIEHIQRPKDLIGKDTEGSILSGIFNGYGAMCCGLIDRIARRMRETPKVIVTGGYTDIMKDFISSKIDKIDPCLVFKGMAFLAENHARLERK
jgi:type III pantothenate kinase